MPATSRAPLSIQTGGEGINGCSAGHDAAPSPAITAAPRAPTASAICSISGLGYYLPEPVLTNQQLAETVDTNNEWIVERTGIHSRRRVEPAMATSDLAFRAASAALADARLSGTDLDLIIVATATPDQPVPATACFLQHRLGASSAGTPAMDISAGCAGFGYAMQMAAAAVHSGMHKRVLVVGADCLTRVTNYADRQSCILFGDGAGAVVMAREGPVELLRTSIGCDGSAAELIQIKAGGSREPASRDSVAGARHMLELRGREVFKAAVRQMSDSISRAASDLGIGVNDFDLIIPHQANARIIEAVGAQLGVPRERVLLDIAETGNMASASIPVALSRARERGLIPPGALIGVVGFGAGTTWACQVLRLKDRKAWAHSTVG